MKKTTRLLRRYRFPLAALAILALMALFSPQTGLEAGGVALYQLREMLFVVPPIFLLLGLLDVWVPRDTMVKYMGDGSGPLGTVLAFVLGAAAAGPLYASFPIAWIFLRKGVKFFNLMVFIGAWSTAKIPMLLFELTYLGVPFTLTRLLTNIPGILLIAFLLGKSIPEKELRALYARAEQSEP